MSKTTCPCCKSEFSIPEDAPRDHRFRMNLGSADTLFFVTCPEAGCATPIEVWGDGTVLDFTPKPEALPETKPEDTKAADAPEETPAADVSPDTT